jgi:hypothetical protein
MHHSKKAEETYLAYGCAHCTVGFFGDGFLEMETRWKSVTIRVTARIPLAEQILTQLHLCADKGFGPCGRGPSENQEPTFDWYIPGQHLRRRPTRSDPVEVALVGTEISAREAVSIMTGHRYPDHGEPSSSSWSAARKEVLQPATSSSCAWCGRQPHPHYECLWRQLRAKANARPEPRHILIAFYEDISKGRKPEVKGTELMKRLLERCVALPRGRTR